MNFEDKECDQCDSFFGEHDQVFFPGICEDCYETTDIEKIEKRNRQLKKKQKQETKTVWLDPNKALTDLLLKLRPV